MKVHLSMGCGVKINRIRHFARNSRSGISASLYADLSIFIFKISPGCPLNRAKQSFGRVTIRYLSNFAPDQKVALTFPQNNTQPLLVATVRRIILPNLLAVGKLVSKLKKIGSWNPRSISLL